MFVKVGRTELKVFKAVFVKFEVLEVPVIGAVAVEIRPDSPELAAPMTFAVLARLLSTTLIMASDTMLPTSARIARVAPSMTTPLSVWLPPRSARTIRKMKPL